MADKVEMVETKRITYWYDNTVLGWSKSGAEIYFQKVTDASRMRIERLSSYSGFHSRFMLGVSQPIILCVTVEPAND